MHVLCFLRTEKAKQNKHEQVQIFDLYLQLQIFLQILQTEGELSEQVQVQIFPNTNRRFVKDARTCFAKALRTNRRFNALSFECTNTCFAKALLKQSKHFVLTK